MRRKSRAGMEAERASGLKIRALVGCEKKHGAEKARS